MEDTEKHFRRKLYHLMGDK